jgi:hypothetical protein
MRARVSIGMEASAATAVAVPSLRQMLARVQTSGD